MHVGTVEEEEKTRDDYWNKGQRGVRREEAILVGERPVKVDLPRRCGCSTVPPRKCGRVIVTFAHEYQEVPPLAAFYGDNRRRRDERRPNRCYCLTERAA